jgi:S1-C subfamily serine protease
MGARGPNVMKYNSIARAKAAPPWRAAAILGVGLLLVSALSVGFAEAGKAHKQADKVYVVKSDEKADKAYFGVTMQELDADLRKGLDLKVKNGVLINSVFEDSPAELSGIEDGDVLIEFNGKKVTSPDELRRYVESQKSGDKVKVKIVRDNKTKALDVTLAEWPEELAMGDEYKILSPEHHRIWFDKAKNWTAQAFDTFHRGRLGVRVMDLNEDLGPYFDVEEGEGVLVLEVGDESVADEMGIKSGDVIVSVDDGAVGTVEELLESVGDLDPGETFGVTVVRKNKKVELEGELDEDLHDVYIRGFGKHKHADFYMPRIEELKLSDEEMNGIKQEMKQLQKEIKELRKEMKKLKESS